MKKTLIVPAALACLVLLAGCGGDTNVRVEGSTSISKGQELTACSAPSTRAPSRSRSTRACARGS
jgi:hypothetical protein